MLKQLPFKKIYLLWLGTGILLLLSYRFAFKNTIEAWQNNRQLKERLTQSSDLGYQPDYLERKDKNLEKIIGLYKADTTAFRSQIINAIALIAEKQNVKLTTVPIEDVSFHMPDFLIEKLAFEGDYFSLNKAMRELQVTPNIGVIRSATWKVVGIRSGSDENKQLVLELYFEVVK